MLSTTFVHEITQEENIFTTLSFLDRQQNITAHLVKTVHDGNKKTPQLQTQACIGLHRSQCVMVAAGRKSQRTRMQ